MRTYNEIEKIKSACAHGSLGILNKLNERTKEFLNNKNKLELLLVFKRKQKELPFTKATHDASHRAATYKEEVTHIVRRLHMCIKSMELFSSALLSTLNNTSYADTSYEDDNIDPPQPRHITTSGKPLQCASTSDTLSTQRAL